MSKRIMAMLLALVMVVGVLPVAALAEEPVSTTEPTTVPTETTAPTEATAPAEAVQTDVSQYALTDGISTYDAFNCYVDLIPDSINAKPTGFKVKVGDKVNGYKVLFLNSSTYEVHIDIGVLQSESALPNFRIPLPEEIWTGVKTTDSTWVLCVDNWKPGNTMKLDRGGNQMRYYSMGTEWYFSLNYDANGGSRAPAAQTHTTNTASETSYTFTIPKNVPNRKGYTFQGWSFEKNGTASYQPGQTCTLTRPKDGAITSILYAVWEKAVPSKPQWSDIRGEMQKVSVHVTCINPDVEHTDKTYPYEESTNDTIGNVQDNAGSYTCTVTVHLGGYRLKYNQDFPREHEFVSSLTADVVLQYNGTDWKIISDPTLELKLTCGSMPTPNPPGQDVLNGLKVLVDCDAKMYHYAKTYEMSDGDYRLEKVDDNTYTVIVTADQYVEKYNAFYPGHTLFDNNTKTIKLVYRYGAWTVVGSNGVTFNVSCEQKYTVTYTDGVDGEVIFNDQVYYKKSGENTPPFRGTPTRTGYVFTGWKPEVAGTVTGNATYTATWEAAQPALPGAIFGSFTMKCVTPNANHYCREGVDIELAPLNAYTNSGVKKDESGDTPVYYFELTVDAEKYLSQYDRKAAVSGKEPIEHTICAGQEPTVIRFNWNGSSWVQGNKPVVNAECKTEPEKPSGDIVKRLIDVQVVCGNIDHSVTTSSLNDDTFDTGNVTKEGDKYTCVITVHAGSYVNEYNATNPGHVLTPGSHADLTVKLVHNGSNWTLEDSRTDMMHVVFNVSDTYTVTYTDGVENEEIFADQNHAGLLSGTATPAFNGTPKRDGYVFGGWNPAVADKVTESKTYTATWKADANGNGIADDEEEKYTVTYTDGVENEEIFADQNHAGLLSGTATPAFNGTPKRDGYVFGGWNPAVADKVTENKTYTAAWKVDANGNGIADDLEDKFTVTYTDGVENEEIFADQVYGNLLSGTATPAFGSTPKRDGYVFDGWNPAVADKVAGNQTYTATWKVDANGNGIADDLEDKFTVTYTDGMDGKIFVNQVYENLLSGTDTPAFSGTPTRTGYVFGGWNPAVAAKVTGNQTYTATWKVDANGNGIADDEEEKYTVTYTDGADGKAFADKIYGNLLSGTATPKFDGTPKRDGYVFDGWNPAVADKVAGNQTYTATWKVDANGNGIADDLEDKYTVTYTDGVKGKAFADQVHDNLLSGTATPAFGSTPKRDGYVFDGWNPAVADKVAGNQTYTATWKVDANGNGIADDLEDKYTVTYTDGVKGKAFADQVYDNLLSGTATPAFNGKPTRKGYTFVSWTPKVTDTVTKTVTYTATWKANSGKDNVPKTGDNGIVPVLGSVLLFSFCGAAACIFDRKRKHV